MLIVQKSKTGIPVFITDLTEFSDQLLMAGGAFGFQWNPACAAIEKEHTYGFGIIDAGTGCIMVSKEAHETFTPVELDAIIAHEEAHHLLGHIAAAVAGEVTAEETEDGIVNKMDWELQADAYAAKQVCAKVMRKAITKMIKTSLTNVKAQERFGITIPNSHFVRQHTRKVMTMMRPRFDALREMA